MFCITREDCDGSDEAVARKMHAEIGKLIDDHHLIRQLLL